MYRAVQLLCARELERTEAGFAVSLSETRFASVAASSARRMARSWQWTRKITSSAAVAAFLEHDSARGVLRALKLRACATVDSHCASVPRVQGIVSVSARARRYAVPSAAHVVRAVASLEATSGGASCPWRRGQPGGHGAAAATGHGATSVPPPWKARDATARARLSTSHKLWTAAVWPRSTRDGRKHPRARHGYHMRVMTSPAFPAHARASYRAAAMIRTGHN
jgi:hypothetical protein